MPTIFDDAAAKAEEITKSIYGPGNYGPRYSEVIAFRSLAYRLIAYGVGIERHGSQFNVHAMPNGTDSLLEACRDYKES